MSKQSYEPNNGDVNSKRSNTAGAHQSQQESFDPGNIFNRLLGKDSGLKDQLDRNARALAQSALGKLDVVSRQEFDAQLAVLQRTRERVVALEAELERLSQLLDNKPPQ